MFTPNSVKSPERSFQRRYRNELRRTGNAITPAIVGEEEEQFLLYDRATDCEAEFVLMFNWTYCREESASIEQSISQVLEPGAVELTGSRFDR